MIVLTLLVLLTIIVNLLVLYLIHIRNKNNCDCSEKYRWKQEFIKYYAFITISIILLIYVIPFVFIIFNLKTLGSLLSIFINSLPFKFLLSVFIAIGFFNIYFIFRYTRELEESKCNCDIESEKMIRKFLNYYSMIVITIYIITTILGVSIKLK